MSRIYELMIWNQDKLIYYNNFSGKGPDYEKLEKDHRIQNCQGLSVSIGALIKQIHPDRTTQFKNFRTREYQFNLLECVNGLKLIVISSVRPDDDGIEHSIEKVYKAYIELVKRNYLYQHGEIIRMPVFDQAVSDILFPVAKTDL